MIRIGFFNIFKRKKDDELELPDIEDGNVPEQNFGNEAVPNLNQSSETQILVAKLDLINARLQNIEQRLANLEQIARQAQEQQQVRRW